MEASLTYLARFSATRKGIERHLRKRFVEGEDGALDVLLAACLARLEELGLIDDERYAMDRARGLRASGKSRRAIREKLVHKGIDRASVDGVFVEEDDDAEFVSAIRHAKKRRLGPFRTREVDLQKELASFARAGFSFAIARRVLSLELSDAETRIAAR